MYIEESVEEVIKKIIETLPEAKKTEIKNRIRSGNYPRTRAEALYFEKFGDYIGAGLFYGLVSAPRRHSHQRAKSDVFYSAELLDLPLAADLQILLGLQLAVFWEKLLKKISE